MKYKAIKKDTYIGERALFSTHDAIIDGSIFKDGESPLKESSNLVIKNVSFEWKYPLWYSNNIECKNVELKESARSGIWYTKNIRIYDSVIEAPKTFRRAKDVYLKNVEMPNALESFWNCKNVKIVDSKIKGDYLLMNSKDVIIDNLSLEGNYFFDGGKNLEISNSHLNSKDAFWNCENVIVKDCVIHGEYIGWNSKNITFINCEIISHQGFCYMDDVKLINCKVLESDLIFEYSKRINADIISGVDSIKNPLSGIIKVKKVNELILDEKCIDPTKTKIIINK